MKIALIIQRYGTEVLGGSEFPAGFLRSTLRRQHEVEVLTTCARDYVTWKNEYPEGTDRIRGVTVRRFANARTRDIDRSTPFSAWIYDNPHTPADEMEWLKQQGPWSPGADRVPAAAAPAVRRAGLLHVSVRPHRSRPRNSPARSILVPTAHDEPAIGSASSRTYSASRPPLLSDRERATFV